MAPAKPLWNARQQKDMKGRRQFHREYVHPATREKFAAVCPIEHVMMQASVMKVVERSPAKLLRRAGSWIQTEVVFVQNLWQVT